MNLLTQTSSIVLVMSQWLLVGPPQKAFTRGASNEVVIEVEGNDTEVVIEVQGLDWIGFTSNETEVRAAILLANPFL